MWGGREDNETKLKIEYYRIGMFENRLKNLTHEVKTDLRFLVKLFVYFSIKICRQSNLFETIQLYVN